MTGNEYHALFGIDGFELNTLFCINAPTSRTALVEIFLDMVPAESANLVESELDACMGCEQNAYLVTTDTWFEVAI